MAAFRILTGRATADPRRWSLGGAIYGPLLAACLLILVPATLWLAQHASVHVDSVLWRLGAIIAEQAEHDLSEGEVIAHLHDDGVWANLVLRSVEVVAGPRDLQAHVDPEGAWPDSTRIGLESAYEEAIRDGAPVRFRSRELHRAVYVHPLSDSAAAGAGGDVLVVLFNTRIIDLELAGLIRTIVGGGLLVLSVVVLLCMLLSRWYALRPLNRLRAMIADARFHPDRLGDYRGPLEFEELAATFQGVLYDLNEKRASTEAIASDLLAAREDLEQALAKEREQAANQALFRAMFEAGAVGIVLFDAELKIVEANPRFCAMTGFTRTELLGRDKMSLVHPEDRQADRAELDALIGGQSDDFEIERRGVRKDGGVYHVISRGRALRNEDGSLRNLVVFLTDVTEQKRAEAKIGAALARQVALIEEQKVFRYIFDSNLVGMCISTRDEPWGAVNAKYCQITGYSRDELKHLGWRDLTHTDDREAARQAIADALSGRAPQFSLELRFLRKDGDVVDVQLEGKCQLEDDGTVAWFAVLAQDITDRRRAENERAKLLESLQYLLANIPDGVVDVDASGAIVSANPAFLAMFEVEEDAILGLPITRLLPDLDFSRLDEFRSFTNDSMGVRLDESTLDVGYHFKRRCIDGADMFTVIVYDNSRIKQLVRDLESARDEALTSVRVKAAFLANMSHELRTPLNGILGMLNLLTRTDLSAEQQDYITTALRSGELLLNLINDILDSSKLEENQVELERIPFDPRLLVEDVNELLATRADGKRLDIVQIVSSGVPSRLVGDPGRIRQILMNLVGNAVKFTEAGEIVVSLHPVDGDDAGRRYRFEVRDTGIGIDPDVQDAIFGSFVQADTSTTRQYGGTGLGLSICRQLVETMGGTISVRSRPRAGSTFTFEIPLEDAAPAERGLQRPPPGLAGRRVLAYDPNPSNVLSIRAALSASGAEVEGVGDVAQATLMIEEAVSSGAPYDVVLVDFGRGSKAVRRLLALLRDPASGMCGRTVAMTSFGRRGDAELARELGFSGYVSKPLRSARLTEVLSAIIAGEEGPEREFVTQHSVHETGRALRTRVLAVDDVEVNLRVVAGLLKHCGCSVDTAENGREAVAAVARGGYDLVLLDCQMPVMDGFEATRSIRAAGSNIPIIAMTAATMPEDRQRCLEVGMNDVLTKPIDTAEFQRLVRDWIGSVPTNEPGAAAVSGDPAPRSRMPPGPGNRDEGAADLLNTAKVAELTGLLGDDAVVELIEVFERELRDKMALLADAFAAGLPVDFAAVAHSLKGASENIGACALGGLCRELETRAREGSLPASEVELTELEVLCSDTVAALNRHVAAGT